MTSTSELNLWDAVDAASPIAENPRYLREQLLTYIGNKRGLLDPIGTAMNRISQRLGKERLRIVDAFSGSGVVSRFFKQYASSLVSNDLEEYARIMGECYLCNRSEINIDALREHHHRVVTLADDLPVTNGFIRRLYSPQHDDAVQPGERVFYTSENAMRIDSMRYLIDTVPERCRAFLLAPLLSRASVHANTSGVFKGFYKNAKGIGQFGGNKRDALSRIMQKIELPLPIFSHFECDVDVRQQDANQMVRELGDLDVAYFDPPYNQHPYGSNYFMLNLIAQNEEPTDISKVSGIAQNWKRSHYNKRASALKALTDLMDNTPASHILISYNSEGFITRSEFDRILQKYGKVDVIETVYNTFRGSRNLRNRAIHVKEHLFLVERQ